MRKIITFNDSWQFSKNCLTWEAVTLPHTWNAVDGQDGGNDYWRGVGTYRKTFPKPETDGKIFLEVCGAANIADVTLNGKAIAHHAGGYSTFRAELTDLLPENILTVAVDNGENNFCYPQKADFTFYGGLYRSVNLIAVPENHFELCKDGTPGIHVTPVTEGSTSRVTVETWVVGTGDVTVSVDGQEKIAPAVDGYAKAEFVIENAHLWDGVKFVHICGSRYIDRPEAGKVVGALMQKMIASRGDVAKSASNNANLQKMLAGMSFQSLLKQAGDAIPQEVVKSLNDRLQKIRK